MVATTAATLTTTHVCRELRLHPRRLLRQLPRWPALRRSIMATRFVYNRKPATAATTTPHRQRLSRLLNSDTTTTIATATATIRCLTCRPATRAQTRRRRLSPTAPTTQVLPVAEAARSRQRTSTIASNAR